MSSSEPTDRWMHVGISGDGLEMYVNGDDASVSPSGKQVHVRITERQGYLLMGMLQEKLEMRRKLMALQKAQTHAGDAS